MTGIILADDYLDPDVAYLRGMIVARGTLIEQHGTRDIIIEFPYQNLEVGGDEKGFRPINVPTSIDVGLTRIRNRMDELLNCDIRTVETDNSRQLILTTTRRTIGWRNILLHLNNKTDFRFMDVPEALFHPDI